VLRGNVAHAPADGIGDPGLALEGRIDFEEAVIDGLTVGVEQHFVAGGK
jgi:hypothetical protein